MAKVSANPTLLNGFVTDVASARVAAGEEQASLSSFNATVVAGCPGRSVDLPALGALTTVLANMAGNETFVSTVCDTLVAADTDNTGGVVTINASVVDRALASAGAHGAAPAPVQFDPVTMEVAAPTSGMVDDPINASNGNMIHHETDVEFPAIAAALSITRTWNSLLAERPGAFGAGWSSVLDVRLEFEPHKVIASLADGNVVGFVENAGGWAAPGVPRLRLEHAGDGWVVQTDTVRRFLFDADGRLTGWHVGVSRVDVVRDGDRIIELIERITGRALHVQWTDDGVVDRLDTDDGRAVRYLREDGALRGTVSDAGAVRYVWAGSMLVSVVDADDVAAFVNTYDESARVTTQTSPFGRVSTYTYDESGLTVFSDAAGVVQGMRHDRLGNLTEMIDVDGSAMRLFYDDARRVVRVRRA